MQSNHRVRQRHDTQGSDQSSWCSPPVDVMNDGFDWNSSISALTGSVWPDQEQQQQQLLVPVPPISIVPDEAVAAIPEKRVPRPPNAWILYRSDCIQKLRANTVEGAPRPTQADLSKQFGEKWRNEDPEVKARYERLAEIARDDHAIKNPDWKFSRKPPKGSAAASRQSSQQPPSKRVRTRTREDSSTTPDDGHKQSYPLAAFAPAPGAQDPSSTGFSPLVSPELSTVQPLPQAQAQTSSRGSSFHPYEIPYVFPQVPRYAQSIRKPSLRPDLYTAHSYPDGLQNTLARRSSSAVELFNVYQNPQASHTFPAHDSISQGLPAQQNAPSSSMTTPSAGTSAASSLGNNGFSGQEFPSFYSTSKLLPFGDSQQSLPSFLPFGMSTVLPSNHFSKEDQSKAQPAEQASQSLEPTQLTWLAPESQATYKNTLPATIQPQELQQHAESSGKALLPDWLAPYRGVRVRQDDVTGVPLLDFLSELSAESTVQAAASQVRPPLLITPPEEFVNAQGPEYAFPGSL